MGQDQDRHGAHKDEKRQKHIGARKLECLAHDLQVNFVKFWWRENLATTRLTNKSALNGD